MVDAAVLEKLEAGFAKLAASNSKSLLKKYLTKEVFDSLKNKKTPTFGSTLLDVIQSGYENHDSGVGIYAPDAEAYTTFAELFDPIIEGEKYFYCRPVKYLAISTCVCYHKNYTFQVIRYLEIANIFDIHLKINEK